MLQIVIKIILRGIKTIKNLVSLGRLVDNYLAKPDTCAYVEKKRRKDYIVWSRIGPGPGFVDICWVKDLKIAQAIRNDLNKLTPAGRKRVILKIRGNNFPFLYSP